MKRRCILTLTGQFDFDPDEWVAKMKAAGFNFDSDTCPVKIKQPWGVDMLPDGSYEYWQDDAQ